MSIRNKLKTLTWRLFVKKVKKAERNLCMADNMKGSFKNSIKFIEIKRSSSYNENQKRKGDFLHLEASYVIIYNRN